MRYSRGLINSELSSPRRLIRTRKYCWLLPLCTWITFDTRLQSFVEESGEMQIQRWKKKLAFFYIFIDWYKMSEKWVINKKWGGFEWGQWFSLIWVVLGLKVIHTVFLFLSRKRSCPKVSRMIFGFDGLSWGSSFNRATFLWIVFKIVCCLAEGRNSLKRFVSWIRSLSFFSPITDFSF